MIGAVYWLLRDDAAPSDVPSAPVHTGSPPPPAVYVTPDPNPTTLIQGTEASVSTDLVRLQLFATSPGTDPGEGTAVLGTHATNPQTYATGSVLASGAMIEEVHFDHVVLEFRGSRTHLYRVGIHSADDEALVAATTVGGPGIADRPIDDRVTTHHVPTDFIRPRLVFDGEKVAGFEVTTGRNAYRLSTLDLEAGDVIRSIDGRAVTADADWRRLTESLGSGRSVVLGIDRKNSAISILLDGARLTSDSQTRAAALQSFPSR